MPPDPPADASATEQRLVKLIDELKNADVAEAVRISREIRHCAVELSVLRQAAQSGDAPKGTATG